MKTNNNNNRNENSNATRAMVASVKAMINAEYLQRVDLVKYGIQVFAAYLDNEEPREYYVIIAAERDIKTGRYYFIDRDGVRIAWSRLNAETLAYACRDFIDQVNADQSTEERAAAAEPTNTNTEAEQPATEAKNEPQSEPKAPTTEEPATDYASGTADNMRRRWQSFKAKAARVALAVAPWFAMVVIFAITGLVFVATVLKMPEWVESLPILPRAFIGCLFIFLPTMGAEMLTIKVLHAIDRRGWFGFNPLAFS